MRGRAVAVVCVLALAAAGVCAQTLDIPTPYVPSTRLNVDEMLRLADVQPEDLVYDLGSGDGRIVIAAARDYGARGVGIELDAALVAKSIESAQRAGVGGRATFRQADVLTVPLKDASVVTLYLLPPLVRALQDRLYAELQAGARIVAHEYPFPDWQADRHVLISKNFYLYTVPARVAGTWMLTTRTDAQTSARELQLTQRFQQVRGAARVPGGILPAFEARLSGNRIAFILAEDDVSYRYEGMVRGDRMEGTVRWGYGPRQNVGRWEAARVAGEGA